jgi:hypothetical protein
MREVRRSIAHTGWKFGLLLGGAVVALGGSLPVHALTINVSYPDSSVPTAAQNEIASVVSSVDSLFTNNVTDNITVQFTSSCDLGCSNTTGFTGISYTNWRNAMIADSTAHPQNTFLAAGVATLPASDPIGTGTMSFVGTANAKILGGSFTGTDSALTFNNGKTYEYTGAPTAGAYDFGNIFEHELDEALGITSELTGLANNATKPSNFRPQDYFRYATGSTSRPS